MTPTWRSIQLSGRDDLTDNSNKLIDPAKKNTTQEKTTPTANSTVVSRRMAERDREKKAVNSAKGSENDKDCSQGVG